MGAKRWHRVMIPNRRSLKLAALLRGADPPPSDGPGAADRASALPDPLTPLVVVCHGFTGSKTGGGGAMAMADRLARRGLDTLLFDFTGCGESEGPWGEITLTRQVDDLGAVVEWARWSGYRRIILNGRSFGGATVLAYAAGDRQIDAVCTWAAVARPLQLFSGLVPEGANAGAPAGGISSSFGDAGAPHLPGQFFQDLQRHDLPGYAARISPRPLLLIHGRADEVVPLDDARLLFAAAGEPKELALVKGADHRFSDHMAVVWDLFFRWLQRWALGA